jgi:hypothetical protein
MLLRLPTTKLTEAAAFDTMKRQFCHIGFVEANPVVLLSDEITLTGSPGVTPTTAVAQTFKKIKILPSVSRTLPKPWHFIIESRLEQFNDPPSPSQQ